MTATEKQFAGDWAPGGWDVVCFGEVLWDCLPEGMFFGGAPANVAYHLARLGRSVALLSCVGDDFAGREAVRRAEAAGVCCELVGMSDNLETGNVLATIDARGNASYQITEPVAWDEIRISDDRIAKVRGSRAFVFGTLAARSKTNRDLLRGLLELSGPVKIFDVNLRAPHFQTDLVIDLARRADLVKLNRDELELLLGKSLPLEEACAELSQRTGCRGVCVTLGAEGAAHWSEGNFLRVAAPEVRVVNTVGAGDAFLAALVHTMLDPGKFTGSSDWLEACCALGALVASRKSATPDYSKAEIPSALSA